MRTFTDKEIGLILDDLHFRGLTRSPEYDAINQLQMEREKARDGLAIASANVELLQAEVDRLIRERDDLQRALDEGQLVWAESRQAVEPESESKPVTGATNAWSGIGGGTITHVTFYDASGRVLGSSPAGPPIATNLGITLD